MIISIAGYMGCGKSHISKVLSDKISFRLVDLDREISEQEGMSVAEIFRQKGELAFRKLERTTLENLLKSPENIVLSLGGGTPAYFDNMDLINRHSTSFVLQTSIATLAERLGRQKSKRPLIAAIADEDLPEFIAKHLFERMPYYNLAQHKITTDGKEPDTVAEEIIRLAGL